MFIPCMCCGKELPDDWSWWVCDTCGYRVCPTCFPSYKCPKCTWGHMNIGLTRTQCQYDSEFLFKMHLQFPLKSPNIHLLDQQNLAHFS